MDQPTDTGQGLAIYPAVEQSLAEAELVVLFDIRTGALPLGTPPPPPPSAPAPAREIDPLTHRLIMQKLREDRLWHQRKRQDEIDKNVFAERIQRIEQQQRQQQLQLMSREEHRRRSEIGLMEIEYWKEERRRQSHQSEGRLRVVLQKEFAHQRLAKDFGARLKEVEQTRDRALSQRRKLLLPIDHGEIKRHAWFYQNLKKKYTREHQEEQLKEIAQYQYRKPDFKLQVAAALKEQRRRMAEEQAKRRNFPAERLKKIKDYAELVVRKMEPSRRSKSERKNNQLSVRTERTVARSSQSVKDYLHQLSSRRKRKSEGRVQQLIARVRQQEQSVDLLLFELGRMDDDLRHRESVARVKGRIDDEKQGLDGKLVQNIESKLQALRHLSTP